ncbi:hypothetical protein [Dapis sp. BLCC M229]|uniref:hypothetical protein n=1 Tax=Dapis sp. BLCC M229 TaxID=3400188 RepID=UPI003CEC3A70
MGIIAVAITGTDILKYSRSNNLTSNLAPYDFLVMTSGFKYINLTQQTIIS